MENNTIISQSTTFVDLVRKGIVSKFSVLRKSKENGYPFITLLNKKNVANNVYFSKNAGTSLLDTFGEAADITAFLKTASVILTQNNEGEDRYKIIAGGEYVSASDALGLDLQTETNFDYKKFEAEFTPKEAQVLSTAE